MITNNLRTSGQYFGKLHRQICVSPGLLIVESSIQPKTKLPIHSHENAYFNFVCAGGFEENVGGWRSELRPNVLTFHPAYQPHCQTIGEAEVRWLNIELSKQFMERFARPMGSGQTCRVESPNTVLIVNRMASELGCPDELSQLVLSGLIFELCGNFFRESRAKSRRPLAYCAKEIIDSRLTETIGLQELAKELETTESRLATEFRAQFKQTIGDYIRNSRIAIATRLMADADRSLANISLELGFFDQSHFSRSFKRVMGTTPNAFRKQIAVSCYSGSKPIIESDVKKQNYAGRN